MTEAQIAVLDKLSGMATGWHHLPGVQGRTLHALETAGLIRTKNFLAAGSSRSFYRTTARITMNGRYALAAAKREGRS